MTARTRWSRRLSTTHRMIIRAAHATSAGQTTFTYDTSGGGCPRITQERDWAEVWNGDDNDVPATNGSEDSVTTFSQASGVGTMTLSDGTVYREYYGTGYQSGLVTTTKNYATSSAASSDSDSSPTWKKKTTTAWTQD